jgi:LysR family transcriptional regulator, regulator for bpeEF and oprC
MPVVGYFSASTGMTQPLTFRRGEETIKLGRVRNDVLVSESNALLATALAGLGIVHTLDFMVRPFIEQKRLAPILTKWRPDPLQVYIAYPPSRRYSTKVRVFADWAATLFASA